MASWHSGGLVLWVHRTGPRPSCVKVEFLLELLHPTQPRRLRVAHCTPLRSLGSLCVHDGVERRATAEDLPPSSTVLKQWQPRHLMAS